MPKGAVGGAVGGTIAGKKSDALCLILDFDSFLELEEWLGDFVWLDEVFTEDFVTEVGGVAGVVLEGVAGDVLDTVELLVVSEKSRFLVPPLNIAFTSSHE